MRILINHRSDVNKPDRMGRTPILHAVDSHNYEAVNILLEAGADPNPTAEEGQFRSSPLTAASFGGLAEMVNLLLEFGAKIDAYNPEGQTALHAAATTQSSECTSILLAAGASPQATSGSGHTPLMTAIIHNSYTVLKVFLHWYSRYTTCTGRLQLMSVITEHADAETMSIIESSLPLNLFLDLGEDDFIAGRSILRQRSDYDENLSSVFEKLLYTMAKRTGFELLN